MNKVKLFVLALMVCFFVVLDVKANTEDCCCKVKHHPVATVLHAIADHHHCRVQKRCKCNPCKKTCSCEKVEVKVVEVKCCEKTCRTRCHKPKCCPKAKCCKPVSCGCSSEAPAAQAPTPAAPAL